MKDIRAIKGRNYIHGLIEEGEHEHQDFKFAISDARKIARSISAFANNDGGRLLIGVKDNGVVAGIRNEEEAYMIETAAETFCRPAVEVDIKAFKVDDGAVVLQVSIPRSLRPPVSVVEEGGLLKAYYRVKDENMVAPEELRRAWEYYAANEGMLLQLDERQRRLLEMIESQGEVTLEQFMLDTHSSRHQAVDLFGRLISSEVVALAHNGTDFVLRLPTTIN